MEQIEMKFPGFSADPLHSHPYSYPLAQKRNWRRICLIFLLVLLIVHFFIVTLVLVNKHSNDQQTKTESAQHQNQEILNGDSSFHNITAFHDLHNQVKRLHDYLLSVQNGTINHSFSSPPHFLSSSSPVPVPEPPTQTSGNETKSENQNQEEVLNMDNSFHNTSDLHKLINRLTDKFDLLSMQIGATSSTPVSVPIPVSEPLLPLQVQISGNETKNDKQQKNANDSDSKSEKSARASILQLTSKKELVDVIGKAKAYIVMRLQEHDSAYVEFYYNENSTMNPPCQNLPLAFQRYSTSAKINTFGTCIRIYSFVNCAGDSTAFYPQFSNQRNESESESELGSQEPSRSFKSIGRCFANELDDSFFKTEEKSGKNETKFQKAPLGSHINNNNKNNISTSEVPEAPAVPDFLQVDSFMGRNSVSHFHSTKFPITDAILDGESRIKLIRAVIYDNYLKSNVRKFDPFSFSYRFKDAGKNYREKVGKLESRVQVYYKEKKEKFSRPQGFLYWVKCENNIQMYYLNNL